MTTRVFKIDPNYKVDLPTSKYKSTSKSKIVFFTGAGISAASGIPTYRNTNGTTEDALWENYDPIKCSHIKYIDSEDSIAFKQLMTRKLLEAKPNKAHHWISGLQRLYGDRIHIITTNVDDLHEMSGSRNINHLHGQSTYKCCSKRPLCNYRKHYGLGSQTTNKEPCPDCKHGGHLRTDVLLFGEQFGEEYQDAIDLINSLDEKDYIVSIGSSYSIFPFHRIFHASKATTINITLDIDEDINSCFDYVFIEPVVECIDNVDSIICKNFE